ncbi:MAG: response regulator [Bacteroidia bacterium]
MKLNCILLVDDDEITNFINKKILENVHAANHIIAVESGEQALAYLTGTGKYADIVVPKPDLILLDINMPGIDGFEFMEAYRDLSINQKGNVVVVMLTKTLFPYDEIKANKSTEIRAFKYKPLTEELAMDIIHNFFHEMAA